MTDDEQEPKRSLKPGESGSGSVTEVTRLGDTVRRPTGYWTRAVHELLEFLDRKNFQAAPKVIGIEDSMEVLTYLPGEVAMRPWPSCMLEDSGMIALSDFIKSYHEIIVDFQPSANLSWRTPGVHWKKGDIVRHGDLGPWNFVWNNDCFIGAIDWDFAEPGTILDDLAQLAWYSVPLRPMEFCRASGVETIELREHRFHLLCRNYGVAAPDLLDALAKLQKSEHKRTAEFGAKGLHPWKDFLERGDLDEFEKEMSWLESYR